MRLNGSELTWLSSLVYLFLLSIFLLILILTLLLPWWLWHYYLSILWSDLVFPFVVVFRFLFIISTPTHQTSNKDALPTTVNFRTFPFQTTIFGDAICVQCPTIAPYVAALSSNTINLFLGWWFSFLALQHNRKEYKGI